MAQQCTTFHECTRATHVFIHTPGDELDFASIMYTAFLHEHVTSLQAVKKQLSKFAQVISSCGVPVSDIRKVLGELPRDELERIARKYITVEFKNPPNGNLDESKRQELLGLTHIGQLKTDVLLKAIAHRAHFHLEEDPVNTNVKCTSVECKPLANLVFARDQQFHTPKGIVLSHMCAEQRGAEAALLSEVWQTLHAPIAADLNDDGKSRIEGGDFIMLPIPKTFNNSKCDTDCAAVIGVGLRTNWHAVRRLMDADAFGCDYVFVVCTEDSNQERMHLDTIFNIVDLDRVVLLETVMNDPALARTVRVFCRQPDKHYEEITDTLSTTDFPTFLEKELDKQIIPITEEQQLHYAINFLNLGFNDERIMQIVCVHPDVPEILKKNGFEGEVHYVPFDAVTAMFGAAHCCTAVMRRCPVYDSWLQENRDSLSTTERRKFSFSDASTPPIDISHA